MASFLNCFKKLKIALISDNLTKSCLQHECKIFNLTPKNYKFAIKCWKPDLIFVESSWQGVRNSWKFKVAAYPDYPERSNIALCRLVEYAQDLSIPCVFWNKEDGVHFERFIESASLFDTIFTVDVNCIEKYKQRIKHDIKVAPLMFAVQPKNHFFCEIGERLTRANFVGSYSHHIHDKRRERQDMLLSAAAEIIGLTSFDRNSNRKSINYRYPEYLGSDVKKRVPHHKTAEIYKRFMVSLNLNTIDDSETMFSRRLIEILACGGLAVTTPALSVDKLFRDYCYVVDSKEEAVNLFSRLKSGYSARDLEMMRSGAEYVLTHHTYAHRLTTILSTIGL